MKEPIAQVVINIYEDEEVELGYSANLDPPTVAYLLQTVSLSFINEENTTMH